MNLFSSSAETAKREKINNNGIQADRVTRFVEILLVIPRSFALKRYFYG